MKTDDALTLLHNAGDAQKAVDMAAYHKAERPYFGVANPVIDDMCKAWRKDMNLDQRLALCAGLWDSNIHEARIAAAKLLTQARIRPDDTDAWTLIASWVPSFDAWAIADHACMAGQKRVKWDPSRLDEVETWTTSDHMWTKRAAMVVTLPWTKQAHPKPDELEARDRILGWAATYVDDQDWFIQKCVSWWLRDLTRRDTPRVVAFMAEHGHKMKKFAQNDALRHVPIAQRPEFQAVQPEALQEDE